jgi:hypothetical protein
VDEIPPGAKLAWRLPPGSEMPGSVDVLTSDGRTRTLTTAPRAVALLPSALGYAENGEMDGTFFLFDMSGKTLISTDRGRTWQQGDFTDTVTTVGGAGGWRYLQLLEDSSAPPKLLASNDGGRTWSTMELPPLTPVLGPSPSDHEEPGVAQMVSTAVLPSGGVLLADGVKLWRLAPGGTAFEPLGNDTNTFAVIGLGGAVLGFRGSSPTTMAAHFSTDGEHWQPANLR